MKRIASGATTALFAQHRELFGKDLNPSPALVGEECLPATSLVRPFPLACFAGNVVRAP